MIDDKTPNLSLPLPHADNLLDEDVLRLREAFAALDAHAAQTEAGITEALVAATEAAKSALWSGIAGKPEAFPAAAHGHDFSELTGKPVTFPPATHGHSFAELSGTPTAFPPAAHGHDWEEVGGKPASYPPAGHEHGWTELTGKPATFTPASHSHPVGEISGTLPTSKGGTGNTSGNAPTATRWQNSRTLSLTGEVSGSVSWDGSNSVSLPVTIAASAKGPMMPGNGTVSVSIRRIPSGGTWAYFLLRLSNVNNAGYVISYGSHKGGVAAGDTDFGDYTLILAWRIA